MHLQAENLSDTMSLSSEKLKEHMNIGELVESGRVKSDLKLKVRVPARLQDKYGVHTRGIYAGLKPKEPGSRVQLVYVRVNGRRLTFRPQDLELA